MINNRAKLGCRKWRATVTANTVNSGLPLLALPFFRVVYVDTDAKEGWVHMTIMVPIRNYSLYFLYQVFSTFGPFPGSFQVQRI